MADDTAEIPDAPRTRSLSFYLVLLFLVAPVWSMVPICWVFVIYALQSGRIWSFSWPGWSSFALALCEVFFSIHYHSLARRVSRPSPYGRGNLSEIQIAFRRVLFAGLADHPDEVSDLKTMDTIISYAESFKQLEHDDPRAVDFRNVFRTWFGRVPWSSIRRHEIDLWLYWSIFNERFPADSLPQSHRAVLDEARELLQKRAGCTIPEGSAPSSRPMLLTLDKVNVTWRPITWYASVTLINSLLRMWFEYKYHARYGSYKNLEFLIRIPPSWNPGSRLRPIVLVPGLGLGLLQYYIFTSNIISKFADRPLLILIQPHISQNIFHPHFLHPMNRHDTANCLAGLMTELGWVEERHVDNSGSDAKREEVRVDVQYGEAMEDRSRQGVTMLSHSNGSYTHAWMLKGYPEMISRSCFIDPVTFCSWEGDVCYNFVYRPCATGIELLMSYFVGTELGVANLLQRHFDWSSNALWYEEIPNAHVPEKTMFVIGGKDDIINAERVKRYLRSCGIRKGLFFDPNGRHGQALVAGGTIHTQILDWLQRDC